MKAVELRQKTAVELQQQLLGLLKELFTLRMRKGVTQQLNRHTQLKVLRRDVARVKTVLLEKGKRV